jgi:hypothetical protein
MLSPLPLSAVRGVDVGVAEAAGLDPDEQLTVARLGHRGRFSIVNGWVKS